MASQLTVWNLTLNYEFQNINLCAERMVAYGALKSGTVEENRENGIRSMQIREKVNAFPLYSYSIHSFTSTVECNSAASNFCWSWNVDKHEMGLKIKQLSLFAYDYRSIKQTTKMNTAFPMGNIYRVFCPCVMYDCLHKVYLN